MSGSRGFLGNTPDMKDAIQWSPSSCMGQGDGGEMGKHPRREERDHTSCFSCLGGSG